MNDRDGDHYNLRSGIYPDESSDACKSVFPKLVSQFSTAACSGTVTSYSTSLRSIRTSPSLATWLEVIDRHPEYYMSMELPDPPYRAYQWMDEEVE